jgi:hypothetical protein
MAEFEELRLQVTFTDQATAQLEVLKRSFKELSTASKDLELLKDKTKELDEQLKKFIETLTRGPEAWLKWAAGMGAAGVAIAGTLGLAEKLGRAITDVSDKLIDLENAARRAVVDPAEMEKIQDAYDEAGLSAQTARAEAAKLAEVIGNLQFGVSSRVRAEILQNTLEKDVPFVMETLDQLAKFPTRSEQMNYAAKRVQEYRQILERELQSQEEAQQRAQDLAARLGIKDFANAFRKEIEPVDTMRREMMRKQMEDAEKVKQMTSEIWKAWREINRMMAFNIMDPGFGQGLKALSEMVKKLADYMAAPTKPGQLLPGTGGERLPAGPEGFRRLQRYRPQQREGETPAPGAPAPQGGGLGDWFRRGMHGFGEAQPLMGEGVAGFTGPFEPMRTWGPAAAWAEQLHGAPLTNIERRDLMENQNSVSRQLIDQMRRTIALLSGEEKPLPGAAPLGLLSTQMGGLREDLGGGIGAGYGGMGRLGGGGGGAGGGPGGGPGGGLPPELPSIPSGTGRTYGGPIRLPSGWPALGPGGTPLSYGGRPLRDLRWPGGAPVTPQLGTSGQVAWPRSPYATIAGAGGGGYTTEGGNEAIAKEREQAIADLQRPESKKLLSWVLANEVNKHTTADYSDVLESLVNRSVAYSKRDGRFVSPTELMMRMGKAGFYGPLMRYRLAHGGLPEFGPGTKAYDLTGQALAGVGAGRNVLGGATNQGEHGTFTVRGEGYGWLGIRGEQQTAAARAARGDVSVTGRGTDQQQATLPPPTTPLGTPEGARGVVSPVTGTFGENESNLYGAHRRGGRPHSGVDWRAETGSNAVAMTGGTVTHVGYDPGGYDHYAVVKGDDGIYRRYAYHGQDLVKVGQRIEQGQPVGIIGRRHLHYEEIHPTLPDGRPNPVYREFQLHGNASTSYMHGTTDPRLALGIRYGTRVQAGTPLGGQTVDVSGAVSHLTPEQAAATPHHAIARAELDRSALDRAAGHSLFFHRVRGTGRIDVSVSSKGQESTKAAGPFKKVAWHRHQQMTAADAGPAASAEMTGGSGAGDKQLVD